jgi:hypothetical protein
LASNVDPERQGNKQPKHAEDCPAELHIFSLINEDFGSQFWQTRMSEPDAVKKNHHSP